jgi:hypothetical protein
MGGTETKIIYQTDPALLTQLEAVVAELNKLKS